MSTKNSHYKSCKKCYIITMTISFLAFYSIKFFQSFALYTSYTLVWSKMLSSLDLPLILHVLPIYANSLRWKEHLLMYDAPLLARVIYPPYSLVYLCAISLPDFWELFSFSIIQDLSGRGCWRTTWRQHREECSWHKKNKLSSVEISQHKK